MCGTVSYNRHKKKIILNYKIKTRIAQELQSSRLYYKHQTLHPYISIFHSKLSKGTKQPIYMQPWPLYTRGCWYSTYNTHCSSNRLCTATFLPPSLSQTNKINNAPIQRENAKKGSRIRAVSCWVFRAKSRVFRVSRRKNKNIRGRVLFPIGWATRMPIVSALFRFSSYPRLSEAKGTRLRRSSYFASVWENYSTHVVGEVSASAANTVDPWGPSCRYRLS